MCQGVLAAQVSLCLGSLEPSQVGRLIIIVIIMMMMIINDNGYLKRLTRTGPKRINILLMYVFSRLNPTTERERERERERSGQWD